MSDTEMEILKRIEAKLDALASTQAHAAVTRAHPNPGGGAVFPNYGRGKGMPVAGAPMAELEYYANGARKSLADPAKQRFHAKERALLDAIEAEISKQGGGAPSSDGVPADSGEEDCPF